MPERIIRPGILTSDPINRLNWAEEVFYRRLMSVIDDYGRFDGRPTVLRANLYPLKLDHVSDSDVRKWLDGCSNAGVIRAYSVDGKEFIEVLRFNQRIRGNPKWPAPDGDPPQSAASRGDCRPSSETLTGTETHSGTETQSLSREKICAAENPDPLTQSREAAYQAFDQWAGRSPPVGIGRPLEATLNEKRKVADLVLALSQEPPIVRNGGLVGQHLLVAVAVDALAKSGRPFKGVGWAVGCVKNKLADWARDGEPAKEETAFEKLQKQRSQRKAAKA
jgi:hypothetical protein